MIYYGYSINSGADNMRIDSEILDRAIEQKSKEPVFRLTAGHQNVSRWAEIKKILF